jgi:hypothetical protein
MAFQSVYSKSTAFLQLRRDTDSYRLVAQRLEEEKVLAMTEAVLQAIRS